jgi:hypothetical protein
MQKYILSFAINILTGIIIALALMSISGEFEKIGGGDFIPIIAWTIFYSFIHFFHWDIYRI